MDNQATMADAIHKTEVFAELGMRRDARRWELK